MREQREIRARRGEAESRRLLRIDLERAKLHEVVAAAAGAELLVGLVAEPLRDGRHLPIGIEHRMLAKLPPAPWPTAGKRRPHAKPRLALDGCCQPIGLLFQPRGRCVKHAHLHPAGDVNADRVGNHRVVGRQHPADRQAVADMRIGHQGPGHSD